MPEKPDTAKFRSRIPMWLPVVLLGLVTVALYWPATRHGFLTYDDPEYVTSNVRTQAGLTLENLKWAIINPVDANWHPLTMLSHMLDCELFNLNPWGHHLTSILWHALNTALVFLLLRGLTGAQWRSVMVAALFGWHPAHVESVAWVAERKDVLSTCLGLLTLIFYVAYVRRLKNQQPKGERCYWLALACFACGLMSKPMLVTWPFVMLLLDYWPLERWKTGSLWRLVREKLPFFAMAVAGSIVTFVVQRNQGALETAENLPPGARVANALVSYCRYLGKIFWPEDLAVLYPHPGYWPLADVILAGGLLAILSVLFWGLRRQFPFLLMGWLWFIGTLVPVIGLVQAGGQSMADRYTYIPSLGVFIIVVWVASALTHRWRYQLPGLSFAGLAAAVLCLALTRQQLGYWQDSETLFRHAIAVTGNNPLAHYNLGVALDATGQIDAAVGQYQEVIRLKPDYASARNNLGIALFSQGRIDEAASQFTEVIRLKPDYAEAYFNLGKVLLNKGEIDEPMREFQTAVRLKPDFAEAHENLGIVLSNQGRTGEAVSQYQAAIRLKPDYLEAHNNLGNALLNQGRIDDAIGQFQAAILLNPDFAETHNSLGVAFGRKGRIAEATSQFQAAIQLKPDYAEAHNNLGNALLNQGRMDEAIGQYQEAVRLRPDYDEARANLAQALQIKNTSTGR